MGSTYAPNWLRPLGNIFLATPINFNYKLFKRREKKYFPRQKKMKKNVPPFFLLCYCPSLGFIGAKREKLERFSSTRRLDGMKNGKCLCVPISPLKCLYFIVCACFQSINTLHYSIIYRPFRVFYVKKRNMCKFSWGIAVKMIIELFNSNK